MCPELRTMCPWCRWADLDDSPVTWHIVGDIAGAAANNGASFDPFITEPWQLSVTGIY